MSDEYLLEKQGRDAEIERLENMLSVYRIDPVVPRLARAKQPAARSRFGWRKLGYVFAFASLAVAVTASIATFTFVDQVNREVSSVSPAETPVVDRSFAPPSTIDQVSVNTPTISKDLPIRSKNEARPTPAVIRKSRPAQTEHLAASSSTRLTKEEKYAYDQLMVALWITGSKLKVVQDTIDRVDDRKTEPANNKR